MTTAIKEPVTLGEAFLRRWNNVPKIAFNSYWMTTKDCPSRATAGDDAPSIHPGEIVGTTTTDGRRMLLTGTLMGNVVLMERYQDDPDFLIWCATPPIRAYVGDKVANAITFASYNYLIGSGVASAIARNYENVNSTLQEFHTAKFNKFKRELRSGFGVAATA